MSEPRTLTPVRLVCLILLTTVAWVTLVTRPAAAQTPAQTKLSQAGEWLAGRVSVHADGGYQAGSRELRDTFYYRAYGESARFESIHDITGIGMLDFGASLRLWRRLVAGASYSRVFGSDRAVVTGFVPHPILFNSARIIQPQSFSLTHVEQAVHLRIGWTLPIRQLEGVDVTVFGGPSFFNVTQGAVTAEAVGEAGGPPFSSVVVDQTKTSEHRKNGVGVHGGVDITYMVTSHIGVGVLARFTGGSVALPSAGVATIPINTGGIQTGGGIRFRF